VFEELLKKDPLGSAWLPRLLDLAEHNSLLGKKLARSPGHLIPGKGLLFERSVPPSAQFLVWLVKNPQKMSWPLKSGKPKKFGPKTQLSREKLFGIHGIEAQKAVIKEAINAIEVHGARGSRRKWWAFEGFTSVDCSLETENFLLFIEGKRTDILSPSTEWFEGRSQLLRNLETCKEIAGEKQYFVLVICEENPILNLNEGIIRQGLPHISENDRVELMSHFLGFLRWKDVSRATGIDYSKLPDKITDV
jgi:hypothetical protein